MRYRPSRSGFAYATLSVGNREYLHESQKWSGSNVGNIACICNMMFFMHIICIKNIMLHMQAISIDNTCCYFILVSNVKLN